MNKFFTIVRRNFDLPLMLGAVIATLTGQFALSIILILGAIYMRVYSNHLSLQGLYNVLDVIALKVFNRNYELEQKVVVNQLDAQKVMEQINEQLKKQSMYK